MQWDKPQTDMFCMRLCVMRKWSTDGVWVNWNTVNYWACTHTRAHAHWMLHRVSDYDAGNEMRFGSTFIHFTGVIFNGHDNANSIANDMWSMTIHFGLTFWFAFHIGCEFIIYHKWHKHWPVHAQHACKGTSYSLLSKSSQRSSYIPHSLKEVSLKVR